jgi:hypothetical protein
MARVLLACLREVCLSGEVTEPLVWIIDSEQWPRALLRAVGFPGLGQALQELQGPSGARPWLIVLELRKQAFRRDDLYTLAREGIPVIVLGGAVELGDHLVKEFAWAAVMRRPFAIGAVAEVVEQVLGRSSARSPFA